MEQARNRNRVLLVKDLLPASQQEVPFPPELFQALVAAGGAGYKAAFGGFQLFQQGPQALALGLIADAPGNPQVRQGGGVHQIMACQAEVGGEAGPFGPQGSPDHLHQDLLAFVEQIADGRRG